ncbi:hypothetical protein BDP67DRAFT_223480 [Colletotrichum lupini]|nr:hypothetical protein BDP67DRAFT_223480 [Colletotrichum lupini]
MRWLHPATTWSARPVVGARCLGLQTWDDAVVLAHVQVCCCLSLGLTRSWANESQKRCRREGIEETTPPTRNPDRCTKPYIPTYDSRPMRHRKRDTFLQCPQLSFLDWITVDFLTSVSWGADAFVHVPPLSDT